MKKYFFFTLIVLFISANLFSQGSGSAINCGSNDAFVGFCSPDFGFTSGISVTAWVKWDIDPSTYGIDGKWANISSNNAFNASDAGQYWLQHSSDNSHFEFSVYGSNRSYVWSDTRPQQNVWYHVAGVYDASLSSDRLKIYVNGVFENGNNNVYGNVTTYQSTYLCKAGRWSCDCGDRSFCGVIDELTIWNKALSQEEIQTIMCKKLTGSETGLQGYWRFDEGALDTAADLSGNGYNGYVFKESGKAESGTDLTITDTDKSWTVNEWTGHLIGITNGTGAGQKRRIDSNTATTLTVVDAWDTNPDATSVYAVSSYNEWVTSGAAIGDDSIYDYSSPSSVNLASGYGDNITVGTITGNPDGVQIYRIDSAPNIITPPSGFNQLSQYHYFGVFIAGGTSPAYTITYNYDGHPGISDESTLKLAKRNNNADGSWEDVGAVLDQGANTLSRSEESGTEYILGSTGDNSLPVDLSSFTAYQDNGIVILEWITESELENAGFILERCEKESDIWQTLASYHTDDAMKGQGNTSSRTEYIYTDRNVKSGSEYQYRLSDVSTLGDITVYLTLFIKIDYMPEITEMENAFPNPFNSQTYIAYHLAKETELKISVFDMLGRLIKELYYGRQRAGSYHIYWNGMNENGMKVSSGTYIIRMNTENTIQIQKVMFMK